MQEHEVPQDNSQTYGGLRKLLYAVDEDGQYTGMPSNGWEVEELVNSMAVQELNELRDQALANFHAGISSPLEYFMYLYRLDLPQLAQATGLFQWRVKRHMRPAIWSKLSDKILTRYSDVFNLSIEQLKSPKL